MNTKLLDSLLNKPLPFYGAMDNSFKLGSVVYEVKEDEDDGWRSMMEDIAEIPDSGKFFKTPLATVTVTVDEEIYTLVGVEDGHKWLEFGTDNSDDYYPMFVFSYHAKQPKS